MGASRPHFRITAPCRFDSALRPIALLLLASLLLPSTGCVRRRLNVRTNPPGALVYVDNQQIGTTPCSVDFIYYGTREIRLVKPGFETLTVNQPIPTPWYQYPGLDFISENLVSMKIRDNRTVTYNMSPQVNVPSQELVDRANMLRQSAVVPASATAPVVGQLVVTPQRLPDVYSVPIGTPAPGPPPAPIVPGSAVQLLPPPPVQ